MYKFARPRANTELECIYNRDLVKTPEPLTLFYILSDEFHEKFGIDKSLGEVAVYSPNFEKELSCAWIGQKTDFFEMQYD